MEKLMNKHMKILIVDNESRNLRILEEMLDERCALARATDGEQTLQQVDAFRPDLILLDCIMPGKTGLEVCKQLKKEEDHRHIKIILVTGKASSCEKKEGFDAGADDYLTKPFEEDELLAVIERVII